MKKRIMNLDDIQFLDWSHGEKYEAKLGQVASSLGAEKLGYGVTVLPPGKAAFPRHSHWVNEEMFFILAGQGEVRLGDEIRPIREGDFIACPPGGPETAHQITNTSANETLRFLAISTVLSPEICEYPDSGKTGISLNLPNGEINEHGMPPRKWFLCRDQAKPEEYWEGE